LNSEHRETHRSQIRKLSLKRGLVAKRNKLLVVLIVGVERIAAFLGEWHGRGWKGVSGIEWVVLALQQEAEIFLLRATLAQLEQESSHDHQLGIGEKGWARTYCQ
jgi:hypothetical protein